MKKYANVDAFLASTTRWHDESAQLRATLLACGLGEAIKWGKPCYTHDGANIAILQPMKNFLSLMFFKGALLEGPAGVLQEQGANSRSARRVCFTSVAQVAELDSTVRDLVRKAIAVERAGSKVPGPPALVLVEELRKRLAEDPALEAAFERLTPGRQREYNLYISGAKQAKTRTARVEQHVDRILAGKGFRDR